ncbi:MAG: RnfABCDGE type electron transport complex subunit A [Defluviitaleaceae bacterium]|nr:RnfABCDGE type electron transport complex subunit A [Defluviitaleaceae bacterium]
MHLFSLFIGATLVTNIILSSFLGLCSFIGVSKKSSAAIGMGGAVLVVITLSSAITWLVFNFILVPFEIEFMRTIVFILLIASLVQFVEMVMKKHMVSLYKALGVYLPLITTNCAVLGAALMNIDRGFDFATTMVNALGISVGFFIVIYLFSTIRERLDLAKTPEGFKGAPIALITASLMAMGFFGFLGLG